MLFRSPQAVVRNAVAAPTRQSDELARQGLARDIQKELKRVGCYDGEVSGEWNSRTRQAMKTFIDRVNAALPADEPDHILRTMVQGHPGNACGQTCPAGQTANNQGRCLPTGILAQNPSGTSLPKVALGDTRGRDAASRDVGAARPTVPRPAWETTVAAVAPRATDPVKLDGRMAVGVVVPPSATGTAVVDLVPAGSAAAGIAPGSNRSSHMIVPGAIAAFGGTAIATGAVGSGPRTASNPDAQGLIAATPRPAALAPATSGVTADLQGAPKANDRPRPAKVYRAPPPEKFRFPAPDYYVGARPQRYSSDYQSSKSTSFSRIFEKLSREQR